MSENGKYSPADFAEELKKIELSGLPHFLDGGQAVNVWAEFYLHAVPNLEKLSPFTSKDCDIWVGSQMLQQIGKILAGKIIRAESPVDGQLAIFQIGGNPSKVIDLMSHVFGLSLAEVERVRKRSLVIDGIRVMDPLFLFKAKCHNYVHLPQRDRNDERHLLILLALMPEHFRFLLSHCRIEEISERSLLAELKLLLDFQKDKWVRQALQKLKISLFAALPTDDLKQCGMEKIERFAASLPENP